MPDLILNRRLYADLNGWLWYQNRLEIRDEGWKLHISGYTGNAQKIVNRVLYVLQGGNFAHKLLKDTETIDSLDRGQVGKFLTVYPDDIEQAFELVGRIDAALRGRVGRHDSPRILHEKWVGLTVVYTRYGAYGSSLYNPESNTYVNDTIGQLKPHWIADPWVHYPNFGLARTFAPWPNHTKQGWRRQGRL